MAKPLPIIVLLFLSTQSFSQSGFDARKLFAPFPKSTVTPYRSSDGAPGPSYWQNKVNYTIKAALDTVKNTLTASEEIQYINNSPDALSDLWLQMDQNMYKDKSRSDYASGHRGGMTSGYQLKSVTVVYAGQSEKADYVISDTRMQVRLKHPLPSKKELVLKISYEYEVPVFGGRNDYYESKNGKVFEIAQWFPRMCVYDDLNGWNTLPFIGTGEFYCEYGNYDYSVTVPENMIVVGSGELVNEKEMYSAKQLERLQKARNSDKTIFIRTAGEATDETTSWREHPMKMALKTWHYKMENSRDVAFGASAAYVLDAARINLPGGKKALAMSAYPIECAGPNGWARSTEYLKASIEYFSEKWFPYPYPVAINEAGHAGGMEYPAILFDGMNAKGKGLYGLIAHEIGHTWFPMIVGSNERRHAWMDEGFNTFIDVYAADNFNHGEFAPKRDGEYAPHGGNPADEIIPWLKDSAAPLIMERADMITGKYRHPFSYFKPALGLVILREVVLGHDRFDYAFKKYIQFWAYKHPSPDDFFRTMESQAGEDLSYFWRQWFLHNWLFDVAIENVEGHEKDGYSVIRMTNKEKSAFPVDVDVAFSDGSIQSFHIPVEVWFTGANYSMRVKSSLSISSVSLDPKHQLPDVDRSNNEWKK